VSLICNIVGARPNFMKMAPVIREMRRRGLNQITVHTGQHYDARMSSVFFDALEMPQPDVYLGVGAGSHAVQTARILVGFERVCLERTPDLVVVGGDVNSTLACSLAAAKLLIPVAHVESGLRSFDCSMPGEINRIITDPVA
jgi:UDP-N-acetylglucosamine 2-epimerase (non-hydrolysing)